MKKQPQKWREKGPGYETKAESKSSAFCGIRYLSKFNPYYVEMDPESIDQPTSSKPLKRVLLWTSPRTLSSVFTRSIRELPSVKVIFEPSLLVFYGGPGKRSKESDPKKTLTGDPRAFNDEYQVVYDRLLAPYEGFDAVFIKDMALYVEGRYEDYIQGPFANFKHTFLIRHPRKSTISHYKAGRKAGFFFHSPGVHQTYELYKVVQQIDPNPLVLDADDLLENPKEMMQLYCSSTGLPFTEDMLTWEPGDIEEWNHGRKYEIWHGTAMYSSGFIKPKPSAPESLSEYPKIVEECIEDSFPYYEALYQARVRLNTS